jgi:hypothetical protein
VSGTSHRSQNPKHKYRIAGQEIPSQDAVKDLGVLIDTQLSFQAHAESKIATANNLLCTKLVYDQVSLDATLISQLVISSSLASPGVVFLLVVEDGS